MNDTADRYRRFGESEARGQSRTYEEWALGVAGDRGILDLVERLPETHRQPYLVFAVARLLGAPVGPFAAFRAWLVANWNVVEADARVRLVQSNEPGRCASLLPALAALQQPVALLEVGVSAGLCLYPDRYSYRFDGVAIDPVDGPSAVVLESATNGRVPLPATLPDIVWRAGIDIVPLDVADEADSRWLETLAWPGQDDRLRRIRAAADIVRADPPVLVAADATTGAGLAAVRALGETAPSGATLVIVTSGVLVYIPFRARERLIAAIGAMDAHWLALEGIAVIPGVRDAVPDAAERPGSFVLSLDERPLAFTGPHGQSLEWL